MAVPNTFASATSAIPLANLDANFAYYDAGFSLSGSAVTFAGAITLTSGTANGVPYLNASKVLTSGAVLTFDGTILSSTRFAGALNGTVGATTASTGAFTTLSASSTVTISGGTANGVTYLNGSKVLTSGTALTFDGTNLGIGTSSPGAKLESVQAISGLSGWFMAGQFTAATAPMIRFAATTPNKYSSIGNDADGSLQFFVNGSSTAVGTNAAMINPSGNLGLGVTPSAWSTKAFQIGTTVALENNSDAALYLRFNTYRNAGVNVFTTAAAAAFFGMEGGIFRWYQSTATPVIGNNIVATNSMTLDASGNLLVGTTSASIGNTAGSRFLTSGKTLQITSDDGTNPRLITNNVGFGDVVASFRYTSVEKGSISITSTAVAYNTSSDYRLKNITGPITTSGAYIDSLKPVEGTWKADGSTFVGLIAHETQEASRTTVATGTKDGAEMQGMDYSSAEIIANLIAELQSLRARVASLESK